MSGNDIAALTIRSVDVDRRPDRHHVVERPDVLVPEPYAPMAHGVADAGRGVRAVDAVAVSQVEPVRAEDALVLALVGAEGRDHDVAARHDLVPFLRVAQAHHPTIWVDLHDVGALHGDL